MTTFIVNDMTCGHCASAVTRAIKSVDADAIVDVDLKTHQVKVESEAETSELADVLEKAGYPASICACETH